jgi:hypothetical protein
MLKASKLKVNTPVVNHRQSKATIQAGELSQKCAADLVLVSGMFHARDESRSFHTAKTLAAVANRHICRIAAAGCP